MTVNTPVPPHWDWLGQNWTLTSSSVWSGCRPCPQPPSHSCRALGGRKMPLKALYNSYTHTTYMYIYSHLYTCVKCVLYVCSCLLGYTTRPQNQHTHMTAHVRALRSAHTPTPTDLPRLFIGRTRTATFTLVPLMVAKRQTKSDGSEHQLINIANKSKSIEFYAHIRHTPAWPEQARDISLSPRRRPFWDDFLK